MTTLIRQHSRGFWAALAVGIVTGAVMNSMFRPHFALADADTSNGDKFAQLTTQVEQLTAQVEQLQSDFLDTQVDLEGTQETLTDAQSALAETQTQLTGALATIENLVEAQQTTNQALLAVAGTLQYVHVEDGDINGLRGPHLIIEGCNVHVHSGSGATYDGDVTSLGLGNLIVGYNEVSDDTGSRLGSHNLVVGPGHTYDNVGGLVAGSNNSLLATGASVTGGANNIAGGNWSAVTGGSSNNTYRPYASINGGFLNRARADFATVSGGDSNEANGTYSTVSGGRINITFGKWSVISGGANNNIDNAGTAATISGSINLDAHNPAEYLP